MIYTTMAQFKDMCKDSYESYIQREYTEEELENAKRLLNETTSIQTICMAASLMGLAQAIAEIGNKKRVNE